MNLDYHFVKYIICINLQSYLKRIFFTFLYEYFIKLMNIDDMTKEIRWENSKEDLKGDLRCRLKEQIIEFKVIDCFNKEKSVDKASLVFNFFEEYRVYDNENTDTGNLYYLLYITDLWKEEITKKNIELLRSYLSVCKNILFSYELLVKKLFAVFIYCENDEFSPAKVINEKCNYLYGGDEGKEQIIHSFAYDNLHKLVREIYITDDQIEYGDSVNAKVLKEAQLDVIKKVYNWLLDCASRNVAMDESTIEKELYEWLKNKLKEGYNHCWLKYAVDRDYKELFDNRLYFNNSDEKVYINVERYSLDDSNPNNHNSKYSCEYGVRFDTRVLLLDLKNNEYQESYTTYVAPYNKKFIESDQEILGLKYEWLYRQRFVNQFPVPIVNCDYREKSLHDQRRFFYFIAKINLNFPENTVYTIGDGQITLYFFYKDYKYIEGVYFLNKCFDYLKSFETDFENHLPKDNESLNNDDGFWSLKDLYKYNGGIYKYGNKSIENEITIKFFQKTREDNLYKFNNLE